MGTFGVENSGPEQSTAILSPQNPAIPFPPTPAVSKWSRPILTPPILCLSTVLCHLVVSKTSTPCVIISGSLNSTLHLIFLPSLMSVFISNFTSFHSFPVPSSQPSLHLSVHLPISPSARVNLNLSYQNQSSPSAFLLNPLNYFSEHILPSLFTLISFSLSVPFLSHPPTFLLSLRPGVSRVVSSRVAAEARAAAGGGRVGGGGQL